VGCHILDHDHIGEDAWKIQLGAIDAQPFLYPHALGIQQVRVSGEGYEDSDQQ
jgi:hypothetical protein